MPAAAIVAGSLVTGAASYLGGKKAGQAAQRGADRATAESSRQFDLIRSDTAPLRSTQGSALDQLARLYGWAQPTQAAALERQQAPMMVGDTELPAGTTTKSVGNGWYDVSFNGQRIGYLRPGGANGKFVNDTGADIPALFEQQRQANQAQTAATGTGAPDMSAFIESPDYQFNLAEGQKAIDRSLAARGRGISGAGIKEGERYASGLASQQYGSFVDRLLAAAGLGTTGVTTSAQAGLTTAGQVGAAQQNAGNTRASAYMSTAEGLNNAVQGGISNYLLMNYLKKPLPVGGTGTGGYPMDERYPFPTGPWSPRVA
jgi:hypothetical protein